MKAPLLLLLALLPGAPEPRGVAPAALFRVVRTHDFGWLTPGQALGLVGKRALDRVVLDSPDDQHEGSTLYEHAARVAQDGTLFEGFVEDRLVGAVVREREGLPWA